MNLQQALPISVAIATYRREGILLETLDYLLGLLPAAAEILVIDQSERHETTTQTRLKSLDATGRIRWLRLDRPSIPHAMNRGLLEATQDIVLFVDDDIRPEPALLTSHLAAHQQHSDVLVAGRVVQPWQEGVDISILAKTPFAGMESSWIEDFIGCNFSVGRDTALALGGFDENFVRVAYCYEAEFAHRFRASERRVYFEPAACVHHLKSSAGGTRTFGEHLTTLKPDHAVGEYYYCLRPRSGWGRLKDFFIRPIRAVSTRHHLRHPWWIPGTWFAEVWGMCWALSLHLRGPRYVTMPGKEAPLA